MPCRFIKHDSDDNQQALAIPGQGNIVVPTDYSKNLVDTTAVTVKYDQSGGITLASAGYGSVSLQEDVNDLIGDVAVSIRNQVRNTASAPNASNYLGSKGRNPVKGSVDKVLCRYGDNCRTMNTCKFRHPPKPKSAPKHPSKKSGIMEEDDVVGKLIKINDKQRTKILEREHQIAEQEHQLSHQEKLIERLTRRVQELESGSESGIGSWANVQDDDRKGAADRNAIIAAILAEDDN